MSYFLKQTKNRKGIYLQIYETHYNPEKQYSSQKSYKAIGYIHELKEQGIKDPVSYYKKEVNELNDALKLEKEQEKQAELDEIRAQRAYEETELKARQKEIEDKIIKQRKIQDLIMENNKFKKEKELQAQEEIKKDWLWIEKTKRKGDKKGRERDSEIGKQDRRLGKRAGGNGFGHVRRSHPIKRLVLVVWQEERGTARPYEPMGWQAGGIGKNQILKKLN